MNTEIYLDFLKSMYKGEILKEHYLLMRLTNRHNKVIAEQ